MKHTPKEFIYLNTHKMKEQLESIPQKKGLIRKISANINAVFFTVNVEASNEGEHLKNEELLAYHEYMRTLREHYPISSDQDDLDSFQRETIFEYHAYYNFVDYRRIEQQATKKLFEEGLKSEQYLKYQKILDTLPDFKDHFRNNTYLHFNRLFAPLEDEFLRVGPAFGTQYPQHATLIGRVSRDINQFGYTRRIPVVEELMSDQQKIISLMYELGFLETTNLLIVTPYAAYI